jgi:Predicted endonuclease involved in recombination (possible Holliday junction resolvase in Mycoplasmas and B. subtilis)
MNRRANRTTRILAIDPSTRGFGFAVLEGPDRLIDWGVKDTKLDKNRRALELIANLIEQYEPGVVVLENYAGKGSRRCERVAELIEKISRLALTRETKVRRFSRAEVKRAFAASGAKTKYEIAVAIANRFPELAPRLPRFRKPWMSEDYRMSIFDAVGLAVVYFRSEDERKKAI